MRLGRPTKISDHRSMAVAYQTLRHRLEEAEAEGLAFFAVFGCVDQRPEVRVEYAHPRPEREEFFLDTAHDAIEIVRSSR